jgi:ribosomal-protein-alanine N-acetyltransferase
VLSHFQDWKNIVNKDLLSKQKIIIESDSLLITKIDASMYYDIYRNSLDDDVKKYVPDETFGSLEEASDVVDNIICNYESTDGPFVYAVIRKSDRVNLGYVQLIKNGNQWEIGYHIAKLFTNCGYATEAVKTFLEFVKSNTEIKEIYATALSNNKASKRVLQNNGFKVIFEGKVSLGTISAAFTSKIILILGSSIYTSGFSDCAGFH